MQFEGSGEEILLKGSVSGSGSLTTVPMSSPLPAKEFSMEQTEMEGGDSGVQNVSKGNDTDESVAKLTSADAEAVLGDDDDLVQAVMPPPTQALDNSVEDEKVVKVIMERLTTIDDDVVEEKPVVDRATILNDNFKAINGDMKVF